MQPSKNITLWKQAPFLRIVLPLCVGIITQWYCKFSTIILAGLAIFIFIALGIFTFLSTTKKYTYQYVQSGFIIFGICILGMIITTLNDASKKKNWYGNFYNQGDLLLIKINEPLVEKSKSYKADGIIEAIIRNDSVIKTTGKILLYFSKDSNKNNLQYGDKIIVHKLLQPIKNSGNPGSFNYKQYASFQQIFHNIFLKPSDWIKTNQTSINIFKKFIYSTRQKILSILKQHIGENKDELGIAEALLIGYTNDLDKDLVQAYSNTGVVHIIAISGMHLGLIYVMLVWLFGKVPLVRKSKIVQVILLLTCLWLFSILTGGSASVLRSAVMFSCIAIGKNFFRQASIFNSLATSAFILLCYNPYYLWDVGFQLSYLAVIGIVLFQKPIYNLFYFKNKILDNVWNLTAVSIAAQLLTFPICIYYFHQFPNLFLLTNLIAVPLSSVILYVEIALIALSWVPFISTWLGKLTQGLVWLMNKIITSINSISFSVWDKLPATIFTTLLLYLVVISICTFLLSKNKKYLKYALTTLLLFVSLQSFLKWQVYQQKKLIVYNVPQHTATDIISGSNYHFIGDSILLVDGLLQNFHLKPARINLQLTNSKDSLNALSIKDGFVKYNNKKILFLDNTLKFEPLAQKISLDVIILSKNTKLKIADLTSVFACKIIVFDASNPLWKIEKWKQECNQLNLQYYSIPEQGAFVLNL